ncbi:hypothetical protein Hanom_Chr16g01434301 [Helianthus anomalus]
MGKSIIYIKTKHFGAIWHYFNPIIATCQLNIPHNSYLSGNIHRSLPMFLFDCTAFRFYWLLLYSRFKTNAPSSNPSPSSIEY